MTGSPCRKSWAHHKVRVLPHHRPRPRQRHLKHPRRLNLRPDTKVHITRKGEKHGPYKYATAKEYLAGGQLLSTDSAWHDGMDEWIPLGEMMGGGKTCPQCNNALAAEAVFCIQCGYNLQTGQGTQSLPAGGAPQAAGPATYNPRDEESQKTNQLLALGIMAIVGAVLPHIAFSPFKIYFQNFDLGGKNAEWFIMMLGPLIVGITISRPWPRPPRIPYAAA